MPKLKMKLTDIPQSIISPVCRIIMLNRADRLIMIKVADDIAAADAETMVKVADDSARIAQMRASKDFDYMGHVMLILKGMNVGFEVLAFP